MSSVNRPAPYPRDASVWPHRLAVVTACATFPVLFIGGLVTSLGAGLAVPDWPTTFGYNMFLYPWSKMVGHIFYEHSHRLVASAVGLLTLALALVMWFQERRNWLRWLGITAFGLVILQGVIGGLRVIWLEQTLAIVHACIAQAFFALVVSVAYFTSAEWTEEPKERWAIDGGRLRRLCAITTAMIYLQAIFGAVLRHTGERLDAHLLIAALVSLHVIAVIMRCMNSHFNQPRLARPALLLGALLFVQLSLGTLSYFAKFAVWPTLSAGALVFLTTSHMVVGALMLVTSLLLVLRSYLLLPPAKRIARQKILTEQFSA